MINISELVRSNPEYWLRALNDLDAAAFCSVSAKHLQALRHRGEGPAVTRVGARAVRYKRCDLLSWLESRKDEGVARLVAA